MKYIRTENGVYTIDREGENPVIGVTPSDEFGVWSHKSDIIAQADTIEELVEEYIIDNWKEKGKPIYCFRAGKNELLYVDKNGYTYLYIPDLLKCGVVIYGAIWTDKGLIYVAKMNEKGELELI